MVSQETLVTQRKHNWRHCLHEIKSCKACIFNTQINKFYAPVGLKIRDRLNSVQVQRITRRRYAIRCHFQRKGSMAAQIGDLQVVICSKRNKTHVPFQLNELSNRQPSQRGRTRHPQKFTDIFQSQNYLKLRAIFSPIPPIQMDSLNASLSGENSTSQDSIYING